MKTMKDIILAVAVMAILFLFLLNKDKASGLQEYKNNMDALADSIEYFKDEDGRQVAMIQSLTTKSAKDLKEIASQDEEIHHLKNVVEKYKKELKDKGSATTIKTITKIDTVFQPQVVQDTSGFPIYISNIDLDGWVTGEVKAKVDGVYVDLTVRNEYDVVVGLENNGLFKKKTPFALVKNYNPYSSVTSLRTYQVSLPKKKRIHIGPVLVVDFTGRTTVGAGLMYSIFSF